jgi:hypothetical protein
LLIFKFGKGIKYWKRNRGPFFSELAHFYRTPSPAISPNQPAPFSSPESLPSGPRCLVDPTCQSHSFVGGYSSATDSIPRPLPSQTRPLPLLQLHAARRCNSGPPVALEPCLSTVAERPLLRRLAPSCTESSPCAVAWLCRCRTCVVATPSENCRSARGRKLTNKPWTQQDALRMLAAPLHFPPCRAKLHGSKC